MNWFIILYRKPFHCYLMLLISLYIFCFAVEGRLIRRRKKPGQKWGAKFATTEGRRRFALITDPAEALYTRRRKAPYPEPKTTRAPILFNRPSVRPTTVYTQHFPSRLLHFMMNFEVPMVTFNNGQKYPIIGLGTWKSKSGQVKQAVMDAIDAGYRHIDTALVYENEREVGEAINRKIREHVITRRDIYVTTKLWNTYHREDLVVSAFKKSLENLRLEFVDLYLIHWPMGYKEGDELFPVDENNKTLYSTTHFTETWRAMEELVRLKLVGSIGVSNFSISQVTELLQIAKIKPVTNQVECHPYLNQAKMREFLKANDMIMTAYSPLGSPDRPWAKPDEQPMLERSELKELALKYDKTAAQIVLRWQIEHGNIVIPKSVTKGRIISNFDIFCFQLQKKDIDFMDSLDCNQRLVGLEWIRDHKDYPFY